MQAAANVWQDVRVRLSLVLAVVGTGMFVVGARPDWLGLARTPEVGFLQIIFMTGGMGAFTVGSIAAFRLLWPQGHWPVRPRIGARLAATGYVTVAAAVMADILGLGSQAWPGEAHFGPVQGYGVLAGEALMALGLLLMLPYRKTSAPLAERRMQ